MSYRKLVLLLCAIAGLIALSGSFVKLGPLSNRDRQLASAREARLKAGQTGDPRDLYIADGYEEWTRQGQTLVVDGEVVFVDEALVGSVEVSSHLNGVFSITIHTKPGETVTGYSWGLSSAVYLAEGGSLAMSRSLPDPSLTIMVWLPVPHDSPWSWSLNEGLLDSTYRLVNIDSGGSIGGGFIEATEVAGAIVYGNYWVFTHSSCTGMVFVTDGYGRLWNVSSTLTEAVSPRDRFGYVRMYLDLPLDWSETFLVDPVSVCA